MHRHNSTCMTFLEFTQIVFNITATLAILAAGVMICIAMYEVIILIREVKKLSVRARYKIQHLGENIWAVKVIRRFLSKLRRKHKDYE